MSRLAGLDALRGTAALVVFAHHLQGEFGLQLFEVAQTSAVDLFFLLSGYLMARTYEARMVDGTLTTPAFVRLRYKRLWLPAAIGSVIGFVAQGLYFGFEPASIPALVAILFFLPFPFGFELFTLNGPIWSLFCEGIANTLHSLLFARSPLATAATFTACALVYALLSIDLGQAFYGNTWLTMAFAVIRAIALYILGIYMFRFMPADGPRLRLGIPLILAPAILVAGGYLEAGLFSVVFSFAIAPALVWFSLGEGESRWAYWLGALSFPLYATHKPVMHLFAFAGPIGGGLMALLFGCIVAAVIELPRRSGAVGITRLRLRRSSARHLSS